MINITEFFYRTTYVKKYLFTTNMFFYTLNNIKSMDNDNKNKLFEDMGLDLNSNDEKDQLFITGFLQKGCTIRW